MDDHYIDEDDDYPTGVTNRGDIERYVEELLRPATQAARSIFDREQKTDVVSGLIMTMTNRAMKATVKLGRAQGENHKLKEELSRQLAVQSRFADAVAWYERLTQIVVGGGVTSSDRFDNGPHASNIRCERCKRQVEEARVIEHLLEHKRDDDKELEIKRAVEQQRYEESRQRMEAEAAAKPKRRK